MYIIIDAVYYCQTTDHRLPAASLFTLPATDDVVRDVKHSSTLITHHTEPSHWYTRGPLWHRHHITHSSKSKYRRPFFKPFPALTLSVRLLHTLHMFIYSNHLMLHWNYDVRSNIINTITQIISHYLLVNIRF